MMFLNMNFLSDNQSPHKMMNSTSNEHEGSEKNNDIDRLSELPDEILVHILSYLPISDAVRTVCIRRFGNLWTLLPSLEFDGQIYYKENWPSTIDNDDESLEDPIDQYINNEERILRERNHYILRFANFVRNLLILHKRAVVDKFMLSFLFLRRYEGDVQSLFNEITTWIRFAIDKQVKELILDVGYDGDVDCSILPQCVFTSQSLVTLHFDGPRIDEPSQVQMGSLKTLSLTSVKATNEVIKKLISGSPSLREMYLCCVSGLNELRFTAPNIQKLQLSNYRGLLDCPNLKILDVLLLCSPQLELVDVSSVREVCIRLHGNFDIFYDLLKKFCNAEVFNYSDQLHQSSEFIKRDFPQTRWKRLYIESLLGGDQILGICNVLRSSPHLEELTVYTVSCRYSDITHDANMLLLELPCLMQQLKTVTLRGYEVPCHGLLRFAEILLNSSVALEKMVILPSKRKSAAVDDVLKFVKQLSSFPRASTNARVIVGSERKNPGLGYRDAALAVLGELKFEVAPEVRGW